MLADDTLPLLHDYLGQLQTSDIELLAIVHFSGDRSLLARRIVSNCEPCRVSMPHRAITADALNLGSHEVLIAHNHPSGDARPSRSDIRETLRLQTILNLLGIRLADHILVGGGSTASFRALGHL